MKTKIIKVQNDKLEANDLKDIKKAFEDGKLVVFPTETVYGLGANGMDEEACKNIFIAKGRPVDNPLILHIGEISQLEDLVEEIPKVGEDLISIFWPGPLTMILKRSKLISDVVTGGLDTVAIRMPSHPIAREILKEVKLPIAAPSANISGRPSPTSFKRVLEDLDGKVDIIVDGGRANYGIESTVIDLTVTPPMILRPGGVTLEDLRLIIPNIAVDKTTIDSNDKSIPKSPGQKYRHYAPKAECYTFAGNLENIVKEINKRIAQNKNKKIAVLATAESLDGYEGADLVINLGSRENLVEVASNLFEALRECDDQDIDIIYAEGFDLVGIGAGIMNRLLKASSGKIVFGL
ncbi:MAG: L-threonylcarbamoyladenylate synthase [Peptoniphilaceae bacterium]